MRLDDLRTGLRLSPPFQDAQEVGEVPLSITELLAHLRSDEPLDLYDVELAFSSLADNYNNGTCFNVASDYAVRAVGGDTNVPIYISTSVWEAFAAPVPGPSAPDAFNEFSHVLPEMERCCRALEAGVVDRLAFAADAEHLAILYYTANVRAMHAVCRYIESALPTILARKTVPPIEFLEGIPAQKYRELGAALLKAVEERE